MAGSKSSRFLEVFRARALRSMQRLVGSTAIFLAATGFNRHNRNDARNIGEQVTVGVTRCRHDWNTRLQNSISVGIEDSEANPGLLASHAGVGHEHFANRLAAGIGGGGGRALLFQRSQRHTRDAGVCWCLRVDLRNCGYRRRGRNSWRCWSGAIV